MKISDARGLALHAMTLGAMQCQIPCRASRGPRPLDSFGRTQSIGVRRAVVAMAAAPVPSNAMHDSLELSSSAGLKSKKSQRDFVKSFDELKSMPCADFHARLNALGPTVLPALLSGVLHKHLMVLFVANPTVSIEVAREYLQEMLAKEGPECFGDKTAIFLARGRPIMSAHSGRLKIRFATAKAFLEAYNKATTQWMCSVEPAIPLPAELTGRLVDVSSTGECTWPSTVFLTGLDAALTVLLQRPMKGLITGLDNYLHSLGSGLMTIIAWLHLVVEQSSTVDKASFIKSSEIIARTRLIEKILKGDIAGVTARPQFKKLHYPGGDIAAAIRLLERRCKKVERGQKRNAENSEDGDDLSKYLEWWQNTQEEPAAAASAEVTRQADAGSDAIPDDSDTDTAAAGVDVNEHSEIAASDQDPGPGAVDLDDWDADPGRSASLRAAAAGVVTDDSDTTDIGSPAAAPAGVRSGAILDDSGIGPRSPASALREHSEMDRSDTGLSAIAALMPAIHGQLALLNQLLARAIPAVTQILEMDKSLKRRASNEHDDIGRKRHGASG
eukprot:m.35160 g.35160  ORF g.35160 m.35160 type:complete len:557 (-) comp5301_c0_seq1:137-1807(-)